MNDKNDNSVTALIQIKARPKAKHGYSDLAKAIAQFKHVSTVYLMSGAFDLLVTVKCENIRQVGEFVSNYLSPLSGVTDISTHFVIGTYKENGEIVADGFEEDDRRLFLV